MQDNVLGKVAQYQSVLTQNIFCVRVFGIIILCPRMVGELAYFWQRPLFLQNTSRNVKNATINHKFT